VIGERLNKIRKEKGITQKNLAEIIGVDKSAVSLYERDWNDPSDEIKVRIAQYLQISLDYLLGVIDQPVSYVRQNAFLDVLGHMSNEEQEMLSEFCGYILFRREKSGT